jgi:methyl-accepting chemotaxis protein
MDDTTRTEDQRLLQESLNLIAPVAPELVAAFYERLFTEHPAVRAMFPPVMDLQRERLLAAIIALVTHYDRPENLAPALTAMGRNHVKYGARLEHYSIVGSILLGTLEDFAGDAWNPEFAGAWERAYTFAAGTMMAAAAVAPSVRTESASQAA